QVEPIDVELAGDDVHQPLDQVRRLGTAGAAIRVGRHLVRVDADDLDLDGGNAIAAGQDEAGERRNRGRVQLVIGAEIGNRPRLDAQYRAVVLDGDLVVANLIAAVNRRRRILAPRF